MTKRYKISDLLANALQPFDDLDGEMLTIMGKDLKAMTGPIPVPIVLSANGRLLDGNQRLKAMVRANRSWISEKDVTVLRNVVTGQQEEDMAWKLNLQRRHLNLAEKKALAVKASQTLLWSQHRLASVFGVTQPTISNWLQGSQPEYVIGKDGSLQPTAGKSNAPGRPAAEPWTPVTGSMYRAIWNIMAKLNDKANLPDWDDVDALQALEDLGIVVEATITKAKASKPKPASKKAPAKKAASARIMIPGAAARMFEQGK